MKALWAIVFCAILFVFAPAGHAADYEGEFGGWDVFSSESSCGMSMEYEGPGSTNLTVLSFADGRVGALITNYSWSADDSEEYEVSFELNGSAFKGRAKGSSNSGQRGFTVAFNSEFLDDLAQGSSLSVYLNDQKIDQLSLTGTAVATRAVRTCLVKVRRAEQKRKEESDRWAYLPKDPFSDPAAVAPQQPNQPAKPEGGGIWARRIAENYPSRAIREGLSGAVGVSIAVGINGRATDCSISSTSGAAVLDEAACKGMLRYSRFTPATGNDGRPIEGSFSTTVNYSLSGLTAADTEAN